MAISGNSADGGKGRGSRMELLPHLSPLPGERGARRYRHTTPAAGQSPPGAPTPTSATLAAARPGGGRRIMSGGYPEPASGPAIPDDLNSAISSGP